MVAYIKGRTELTITNRLLKQRSLRFMRRWTQLVGQSSHPGSCRLHMPAIGVRPEHSFGKAGIKASSIGFKYKTITWCPSFSFSLTLNISTDPTNQTHVAAFWPRHRLQTSCSTLSSSTDCQLLLDLILSQVSQQVGACKGILHFGDLSDINFSFYGRVHKTTPSTSPREATFEVLE